MSQSRLRARLGALLACVAIAAGCTDVTEVVYDEITEANFQPGPEDLGALLAPVYTPLRTVWMGWYGMVDFQEETADALVTPTPKRALAAATSRGFERVAECVNTGSPWRPSKSDGRVSHV